MSLKHMAVRAAATSAMSLAALAFSNTVAAAEPAPPQEPGVVDNAAADDNTPAGQPRQEQPAPAPANNVNTALNDLVNAAYQLPPPDLSAVPPLVDVSVPVGFGVGLPGIGVSAFPITVAPPQLPPLGPLPPPPPPPAPPPPPPWQSDWAFHWPGF